MVAITPTTDLGGSGVQPGGFRDPGAAAGPGPVDLAGFDRAVAGASTDIAAAPLARSNSLTGPVTAVAHQLSAQLSSWPGQSKAPSAQDASAPTLEAVPGGLTSAMQDAVASLQGSYAFAIGATLASRGSTEATKILNTLLKGQ